MHDPSNKKLRHRLGMFMKKRVYLVAALGLVLLGKGAPAQSVKSMAPLSVIDAAGKIVGRFDSGNVYITGLVPGLAVVSLSALGPQTVGFNRTVQFYFTGQSCTGSAYIVPTTVGAKNVQWSPVGPQLLVYVQSGQTTQITYASELHGNASLGWVCQNVVGYVIAAPANPYDVSGLWTEPFTLQ